MFFRIDASIKLVKLRNIPLFGSFCGYIQQYMCGVRWLNPFVWNLSNHVVCQFQLGLALIVLSFLFSHFFFLLFHFMSAPASDGGAGAGVSWSAGHMRDTQADPPFPVVSSSFIKAPFSARNGTRRCEVEW